MGMISRMCWNAHRTFAASCQVASDTRVSSVGGNPVIRSRRGRRRAGSAACGHGTRRRGDYDSRHADVGRPAGARCAGHCGELAGTPLQPLVVLARPRDAADSAGVPRRGTCRARSPTRRTRTTSTSRRGDPAGRVAVDRGRRLRRARTPMPMRSSQDGVLVAEGYAPTGGPQRTHALMSITKSVVGVRRGDPCRSRPARPGAGRRGLRPRARRQRVRRRDRPARARHAQRGPFPRGVHQPDADIRRLDKWVVAGLRRRTATSRGALPLPDDVAVRRRRTASGSCTARPRPTCSGGCANAPPEHAMSELISTLIWAPMGAEHDAEILCDTLGTAVHDGGLARRPATCPVRADAARRRRGAGRRRRQPSGGPCAVAAGPWAVDADVRSAFLGVARRVVLSRAAGTATSSGSGRASTATCCCAWGSTGRCCTSAGVPERSR